MDAQPDLSTLSDAELKDLIRRLTEEEREVSKARRVLHGRIELAKNELIGRLRGRDEGELSAVDVDALSRILAGRLPDLDRLEAEGSAPRVKVGDPQPLERPEPARQHGKQGFADAIGRRARLGASRSLQRPAAELAGDDPHLPVPPRYGEGDRAPLARGGGAAPGFVPAPPPGFAWSPSPYRGGILPSDFLNATRSCCRTSSTAPAGISASANGP